MKWLVMMSPEQLPRTAPATSGTRRGGEKKTGEEMPEVTT